MFHDGMRDRVQLDDGDVSAWFNVCQGRRQGCVLSPLYHRAISAELIGSRNCVPMAFTAESLPPQGQ